VSAKSWPLLACEMVLRNAKNECCIDGGLPAGAQRVYSMDTGLGCAPFGATVAAVMTTRVRQTRFQRLFAFCMPDDAAFNLTDTVSHCSQGPYDTDRRLSSLDACRCYCFTALQYIVNSTSRLYRPETT